MSIILPPNPPPAPVQHATSPLVPLVYGGMALAGLLAYRKTGSILWAGAAAGGVYAAGCLVFLMGMSGFKV